MLDLWKLRQSRRKIVRAFERDRRGLNKKKASTAEHEELSRDEWANLQMEDDGINAFVSDQLWEEAREYDVEVPQNTPNLWEDSIFGNRKFLNTRGRSTVRRLIDEEKARRFDVKTRWVTKLILPILAALIGIIGAITGLVAVLRHTR